MSYSVRYYIKKERIDSVKGVGEITNAMKNVGKYVSNPHGDDFYEIKVEQHLLVHLDEFIPIEFRRLVRKVTSKVTLVTENYGRFGINGSDTRIPVKIGSSIISYENHKVMIVGTSIELIIKAYLLFCKYNGVMPDFKESEQELKLKETQKKLVYALSANRNLRKEYDSLSQSHDTLKFELQKAESKCETYREALEKISSRISNLDEPKPSFIEDLFAFIFDKDARVTSEFNFPNGNPMSVREAKARGLIKTEK